MFIINHFFVFYIYLWLYLFWYFFVVKIFVQLKLQSKSPPILLCLLLLLLQVVVVGGGGRRRTRPRCLLLSSSRVASTTTSTVVAGQLLHVHVVRVQVPRRGNGGCGGGACRTDRHRRRCCRRCVSRVRSGPLGGHHRWVVGGGCLN